MSLGRYRPWVAEEDRAREPGRGRAVVYVRQSIRSPGGVVLLAAKLRLRRHAGPMKCSEDGMDEAHTFPVLLADSHWGRPEWPI